jgi:hypothetical protein
MSAARRDESRDRPCWCEVADGQEFDLEGWYERVVPTGQSSQRQAGCDVQGVVKWREKTLPENVGEAEKLRQQTLGPVISIGPDQPDRFEFVNPMS